MKKEKIMTNRHWMTRRTFLTVGASTVTAAGIGGRAEAAELTAAERANVQLVTDFCAAWPSHDLAKILSFFADNGAYRMTETVEPAKGHEAMATRIRSFLDRVERFEILETFARGPMVFNERIDHFTGGPMKAWHGMGVFFIKDGKIVEWYDYTISIDRA
jgi:limonene-1,2-epoxide hydrolase